MVKQVNAKLPDELHKALRIKLVENETNFSDWLRGKVEEYVGKAPAMVPPRKRKEG